MPYSRDDLRALAQAKVDDGELLFRNQRYSNSYYLFGYGVELGLKARIARVFLPEAIPDRRFVNDIYSHDLEKLLALSGLAPALNAREQVSAVFAANWATVANWSEEARYDMVDEFTATAMRNSMMAAEDGVFQWLRANW